MTAATDHPHSHGTHSHVFLGKDHERNERRVWAVIGLTTAMMVAEIAAGSWFGSMALTADGWHMATHAGAMLISALAYLYARRQIKNARFTFGTGKFGDLAGFASAVVLGVAALMIAWESLLRFFAPVAIDFNQAIVVAAIGLVVNIVSAWLLKDDHHHHDHGHSHDHGSHAHHGEHAHHEHRGGRDNNLRSAYMHVIADALTSVLAIVALLLGKWNGWTFLDPAMGIVGGIVIARWSLGLLRSTSAVLVDAVPQARDLSSEIRSRLETEEEQITDLHVWQVGPGHHAAIVAIKSPSPQAPSFYRQKLEAIRELSHITVEINVAHGA